VFTRESLDRLVTQEGGTTLDASLPNQAAQRRPCLSPVNAEIVELVARGFKNPEIERATGMKRRTIRAHLSELYRQFKVTNRTELVAALMGRRLTQAIGPSSRDGANTVSVSSDDAAPVMDNFHHRSGDSAEHRNQSGKIC
jgi:DNA-binding CsgD family transcriptional regulator